MGVNNKKSDGGKAGTLGLTGGAAGAVGAQSTPHWSAQSSTANTEQLLLRNGYEAYRGLRMALKDKWKNQYLSSTLVDLPHNAQASSKQLPACYERFLSVTKKYHLSATTPKIPVDLYGLPWYLNELIIVDGRR
jgi:hypothetical protein